MHILNRTPPTDLFETQTSNWRRRKSRCSRDQPCRACVRWLVLYTAMRHPKDWWNARVRLRVWRLFWWKEERWDALPNEVTNLQERLGKPHFLYRDFGCAKRWCRSSWKDIHRWEESGHLWLFFNDASRVSPRTTTRGLSYIVEHYPRSLKPFETQLHLECWNGAQRTRPR